MLTFFSGRGCLAWSLVLGNAGNEMTYPPVEEGARGLWGSHSLQATYL